MSALRELYQEVIIDHSKQPRNFGALLDANYSKEGFNPLCGDRVTIHILAENDIIAKVNFEGCGCAISMASASLMTETLRGKTRAQVEEIFQQFHQLITQGKAAADLLGKLTVLAGVAEFPARVKCATLAWHTLKAALAGDTQPVCTE
jgi:nitrogen fixation protein NifU and related proteins